MLGRYLRLAASRLPWCFHDGLVYYICNTQTFQSLDFFGNPNPGQG